MKIKVILIYILASVIIVFCSCSSENHFPLDKKYWTADDYRIANFELRQLNFKESELPNLDNPETSPIFQKLTDTTNFTVVTNDNQLGLTNRGEFTKNMFHEYKDLLSNYSSIDRQDKYKYPVELIKTLKYGLALQVPYIQLGNEKILKEAENPNAEEIAGLVRSNQQVLISNYNLYLDYINYQDRFDDKALSEFSQGINEYFPRLINQIAPNGDYSEMTERIQNMLKKAKSPAIIQELQKLDGLIKSKSNITP